MKPRHRDWDGGQCSKCGGRVAMVSLTTCPDCGGPIAPVTRHQRTRKTGWFALTPMRYQQEYLWFVFVSALDVMLTWTILVLGGSEVNVVADAVIARAGLTGIVAYKFSLVVFVIIMCEVVGRRRPHVGHKLAEWAVAITAIPVVLSFVQLFAAA